MTNKEAISDLETLLAYIPIYRRFYQSISMGIKALEQVDVLQEIRQEIVNLVKTYPFINHMNAYVKEKEVLEIIDKYKVESEIEDGNK